MNYQETNKDMRDKWSSNECVWTIPMSHEEFLSCKRNDYNIYLVSLKPVPKDWLGNMKWLKVLALCSGWWQQCPYFAANGAEVTVIDISEQQLESERLVAKRENYDINIIQGDIANGLPFDDNYFDIIFNPVSCCYIESFKEVWMECNRVLKPGGRLMTGVPNPIMFLYKRMGDNIELKYKMPYNPFEALTVEEMENLFKTDGVQFGHSFDELIGWLVHSGFNIVDFYEDYYPVDTSVNNFDTNIWFIASKLTEYMPTFFCILAVKRVKVFL